MQDPMNLPAPTNPQAQTGPVMPGMTSGMPAKAGLSAGMNPMAQQLQSMGRGSDTMLIHMAPEEVKGLQQLALATGGSLTINPHTGLPEAGWLKKLLPTILGAVLAPFTGGLSAALLVGAGYTVATGSLQKGLMAGLGAFGGAGIGSALTSTAAKLGTAALSNVPQVAAANAIPASVPGLVPTSAALGAGSTAGQLAAGAAGATTQAGAGLAGAAGQFAGRAGEIAHLAAPQISNAAFEGLKQTALPMVQPPGLAANIGQTAKAIGSAAIKDPLGTAKTFGGEFASAAREGLTPGSMMYKYAPTAAAMGAIGNVSDAMQPELDDSMPKEEPSNYEGPYLPAFRQVQYSPLTGNASEDSGERLYFNPVNPYPSYVPAKAMDIKKKENGYAEGGSTSAPPAKLEDLIAYFASKRPGAIKSSVNYPPRTKPSSATGAKTSTATSSAPAVQTVVPGGGGVPVKTDTTVNPEVLRGRYGTYTPDGGWGINAMASGGHVDMDHGSFVVDARTVSELGNGSSNAGIEALHRMGGRPVRGPGDGVSDSVPASIGGVQRARVARDEVVFPPAAVNRLGGGSNKRGADRLYKLMDKAKAARKRADRGEDTKLRRGLA